MAGFAPQRAERNNFTHGLPLDTGVKDIKCPSWDGKRAEEWQQVRRRIQDWSQAGDFPPVFQAAVLLEKLSAEAAMATQHLRAEELMYPGGLLEVVSALDAIHASEAETTQFRTFDDAL